MQTEQIIRDIKVLKILNKLNNNDLKDFIKSADTEYLKNKASVILETRKEVLK